MNWFIHYFCVKLHNWGNNLSAIFQKTTSIWWKLVIILLQAPYLSSLSVLSHPPPLTTLVKSSNLGNSFWSGLCRCLRTSFSLFFILNRSGTSAMILLKKTTVSCTTEADFKSSYSGSFLGRKNRYGFKQCFQVNAIFEMPWSTKCRALDFLLGWA